MAIIKANVSPIFLEQSTDDLDLVDFPYFFNHTNNLCWLQLPPKKNAHIILFSLSITILNDLHLNTEFSILFYTSSNNTPTHIEESLLHFAVILHPGGFCYDLESISSGHLITFFKVLSNSEPCFTGKSKCGLCEKTQM